MGQVELGVVRSKRLDWGASKGTPRKVGEFVQLADLQPQALGVGVPDDLEQGDGHREDHEDVNHLHVGSGREAAGDPDMAGNWKIIYSRIKVHR